MISEELKNTIVNKILKICSPSRIYLFGSFAYGTERKGSDLDLLVIMRSVKSKIRQSVEIWNVLRDIQLPKDIIIASDEEFSFYSRQPGSVYRTIREKGVELYVA